MTLLKTGMAAVVAACLLAGASLADITHRQTHSQLQIPGLHQAALRHNDTETGAARAPQLIRYDAAWLASRPQASGDAQWECLAQAIYHEARGEQIKGQFAVAEVILNRVEAKGFPKTVCKVVHQGGKKGGCAFSFACDGQSDRVSEKAAWAQAGRIARLMLDGAPRGLTMGATHFHTRAVKPGWSRKFDRTASIGAHLFYRH